MYLKRVTRGISLSFALIILASLLAYFFRRLLATELSIEDYGMFYGMLSFFGFFMLFVDLGVEQATTKKIVELIEQNKKEEIPVVVRTIILCQLAVSAFFSILFLLGKNVITTTYFHNPHVASFFWILIVWFFTTPLLTFCAYTLLGFQRTTVYTALDTVRMLLVLFICIIGFQYDTSLYIPSIAYAVINLLLFAGTYPYIKLFLKDLHFFSIKNWREINPNIGTEILKYSIPVAFTSFGWIILTQTDTIVLTYFTSLKEVGLYNIALPISLLLLFFMRPVIIVFAPLVTELSIGKKGKKQEKLSEAVTLAYTYLFVLLIPFALGIALFPEYIILLLFSEKYIAATPALQILAIGTVFYAFSLFNNVLYTGMGYAKDIAKTVAVICGLNLILNIVFVRMLHWSIIGAALATTICYFLLFCTSTWKLEKHIAFYFPWKTWILSLVFVGASGILILWIKKVILWNNLKEAFFCSILFIIFYSLLILLTKTIDIPKTKQLLKKATGENP